MFCFDTQSLNFLIKNVKVKKLKNSSGEITNGPSLLDHARSGKDIILSTGMSSMNDIKNALSIIAFGYLTKIKSKNFIPKKSLKIIISQNKHKLF